MADAEGMSLGPVALFIAWTFVASVAVYQLVHYDRRRPPLVLENWTRLEHTWLICLGIPLIVFFAFFLLIFTRFIKDDNLDFSYTELALYAFQDFAPTAILLAAMYLSLMAFARSYVVEFDDTHIRRRWLWSVKTWPWTAALHVGDWWGTSKLELESGQSIMLSEYARGYFDLIDELKRRGVPIRDHVVIAER